MHSAANATTGSASVRSTSMAYRRSSAPASPASAARRSQDPHSVYAHYRALIALRHSEPAVVDGDFEMLLPVVLGLAA